LLSRIEKTNKIFRTTNSYQKMKYQTNFKYEKNPLLSFWTHPQVKMESLTTKKCTIPKTRLWASYHRSKLSMQVINKFEIFQVLINSICKKFRNSISRITMKNSWEYLNNYRQLMHKMMTGREKLKGMSLKK
jgi:hypothetical protein